MSTEKVTILTGVDTAVHLLRPGAKWEICNSGFSQWDDPRPCPSWEEVVETIEKIKAFEQSINTIWLPEQIEEAAKNQKMIEDAVGNFNEVN